MAGFLPTITIVMKRVLLILLLLPFWGCSKEKSAEQIFDAQASGVVMILNEYYYSVSLAGGNTFYFSDIIEGKMQNLVFNPQMVQTTYSFGTGFFIDDRGGILTNRHVVNHYVKKSEVLPYVQKLISAMVGYAQERQREAIYEADKIYSLLKQNYIIDSQGDIYRGHSATQYSNALKRRLQELSNDYNEAQRYISELKRISVSDVVIRCHSKIGIAYNNSYVTGPQDFKPCVVERESANEEVDLALIRLADGATPEGAYIFKTSPAAKRSLFSKGNESLTLDQQLYLIGYNRGIALASTSEGIRAQLTSGRISQKPDNYRVMYTIPILPGSSGSPVVNSYGELVAVNFAAVSGTQSFNFGIPLAQIQAFMSGTMAPSQTEHYSKNI